MTLSEKVVDANVKYPDRKVEYDTLSKVFNFDLIKLKQIQSNFKVCQEIRDKFQSKKLRITVLSL